MTVPRLTVFCSGNGSNLQAIIAAIRRKSLRAQIVLVLSDNPKAAALTRAKRAGIPTQVIRPKDFTSRLTYDRALGKAVKAANGQWIVLAGFMRILSPGLVRQFRNKILNIHPSLLPAFRGLQAVREALECGVKVTGVTVHFVDEQLDHGPIILQAVVPIRADDTEKTLHDRIHRVEHRLYPEAIRLASGGKLRIWGRCVRCK